MTKPFYQKDHKELLKENLSIKATKKRNPIEDKDARALHYKL